MKQLILTGLTEEMSFSQRDGIPGSAKYFLVFNEGELKIPVGPETVEMVMKALIEKPGNQKSPNYGPSKEEDISSDFVDEDGVDQI